MVSHPEPAINDEVSLSITRRGAVSAAGAFLAGAAPWAAQAQTAASFTSGGVPITVERYDAPGGGVRPAVILLHGADGLAFGERYREIARRLAGTGYHVFLLHYLDRTGERRANYSTIGANLGAWVQTLRDAIAFVAGQPGVTPRIGLVGISLGGAIALSTAAQDQRVKAVVEFFGPYFEGVAQRIGRLPPTLVLHGDQDGIVPVENARAIENYLKVNRIPHEVVIYPGQGHGFSGTAQLDSARRTVEFLNRHLGGGRAEAAVTAAG